jgi:hypothetical protein
MSNFPLTLAGVLVAGSWRTQAQAQTMSNGDLRNTLIVVMTQHTKQPVKYFQGLADNDLVGRGAIIVSLLQMGSRTPADMTQMTDDDERNTIIVEFNNRAGLPIPYLQGKNDLDLVQMGFVPPLWGRDVVSFAPSSITYDLPHGVITSSTQPVIYSQELNNQTVTQQQSSVTGQQTVSETSGWSAQLATQLSTKVSGGFQIPLVAAGTFELATQMTTTFQVNGSTTRSRVWTFTVPVVVPAHQICRVSIAVNESTLTVPYTANGIYTLNTGQSFPGTMSGVYKGSNSYDMIATFNLLNADGTVQSSQPVPGTFGSSTEPAGHPIKRPGGLAA